jgi:hypothetical protein
MQQRRGQRQKPVNEGVFLPIASAARLVTFRLFRGKQTMGVQDRDWYREAQRERARMEIRRQRLGAMRARSSSRWASIGATVWRTAVNCLAVYGALHLALRLLRGVVG